MEHKVTLNGKPLIRYTDEEIAHALAKEAKEELTEAEEQAVDGATD